MFKALKFLTNKNRGSILMFALVFGSVAFMVIISGVASYAIFENKASLRKHNRDLAFQIAEAGINYYRWHLAHNQTDYTDGTGEPGPYVHEYEDKDGNLIGYYSLQITPPLSGSTVVTVESTGWALSTPNARRTIRVRMGAAAMTDYTFLSNANMNFGFTTVVQGTVHSNGGIRFDGVTDSWIKSAKSRYEYCEGPGEGNCSTRNGIWGSGEPKSFWQFPVPAIDFYSVTTDLDSIRQLADNGGIHLTSSGKEGYHLVFSGTNFDLYKVSARDCYNGEGRWRYSGKWKDWYWDGDIYCYDIKTEVFLENQDIPANGAIFIEDDVWLEGTIDGRVSVAAGRFPVQEPYKKIYINNSLLYSAKASDDVIGLFAQGDIIVPYETPDNMEINAAMLSQFGGIYRPFYDDNLKNLLHIFGSQISYSGGGWKHVNGYGHVISGYVNTEHVYDANLRYYPPPGFPVGSTYELISWEEVQ